MFSFISCHNTVWTFLHAPVRRRDTLSKCEEKRKKKKRKRKELLKDIFICCICYFLQNISSVCESKKKRKNEQFFVFPHRLFWSFKMNGLKLLLYFLCIHLLKCFDCVLFLCWKWLLHVNSYLGLIQFSLILANPSRPSRNNSRVDLGLNLLFNVK